MSTYYSLTAALTTWLKYTYLFSPMLISSLFSKNKIDTGAFNWIAQNHPGQDVLYSTPDSEAHILPLECGLKIALQVSNLHPSSEASYAKSPNVACSSVLMSPASSEGSSSLLHQAVLLGNFFSLESKLMY